MTSKKFALILFVMAASLLSQKAYSQDMVRSVSNEGLEKVVSYNVASFTDIRDKTLEDVMAKMPGMSVSTGFSYNGMMVSKVFINGVDMLNGDYAPVKSMKPEDVESIEITENYVYEKILRGLEYSNSVSINVILKDHASSKWSGHIKAGAGFSPVEKEDNIYQPALYSGELQALNIGSKAQTSITLKADNTGLNFGGSAFGFMSGVNSFLSVSPSLAPLSNTRTRINNSAYGKVTSTVPLKNDLQMSLSVALNSDKLKASNYDETDYFTVGDTGPIQKVTGKKATKKQGDLDVDLVFLSNSNKSYFQNQTSLSMSNQGGFTDITGTYPSKQTVTILPMTLENNLSYKTPIGKNILTIDFSLSYDNKPQNLSVERMPFNLTQDIQTYAYTEELAAQYKVKVGKFTFAYKGGFNAKLWYLQTNINPVVEEVRIAAGVENMDNDSRFAYYNLRSNLSATYIDNKFQFEVTTPLNYYRNFFDNYKTNAPQWVADRVHFAPTVSAKYQITDNFSVSGSASGLNDGLLGARIYDGVVLTDFQSFSQGNVNSQNDKSIVSSASFQYRLPQKSFFINGSYNRTNMNQELKYASKFTENFNISGYVPVGDDIFKSITDRVSVDMSKGIASLKGKVGLNASYSNNRSTMDRNNVKLPYSSKSYTLGGNVNGRLFSWLNTIYSAKFTHSILSMDNGSGEFITASTTNGITQSLELIFSPWEKFNFSFLGDHYMNQIAAETYKHVIIVDFKAEYKVNDKWQLIGTINNLLDERIYDYKLESAATMSSSYTSYVIRPRNIMLSAFYKF